MGKIKNYTGEEAIEQLRDLTEGNVCLLGTFAAPFELDSRPMSTQHVDESGRVWFFIKDTHDAVDQIRQKDKVNLQYVNDDGSYLAVRGHGKIGRNSSVIEENYSTLSDAWFDGKDDPSLLTLCVTPHEARYWDTENGKLIAFFKIAANAVAGTDFEEGVSGELNL